LATRPPAFYLSTVRRKCPTCAHAFEETVEARAFRPFCSARCRSADLGKWLDGGYRITAPLSEEDLDQGLPTDGETEPPQ
jgi:endogenous inhibitor of DNA gyrase (YacG/DUF329 family)